MPGTPQPISEWVDHWVADMSRPVEFGTLVDRIVAAVVEQVPVFGKDADLVADLEDSARAEVRAFMSFVSGPAEDTTPAETSALVRTLARRGIELERLLKVYRVGLGEAQRYLAEAVEERTPDVALRSTLVAHLLTRAGDWVDRSLERLSVGYNEERRRWLRGDFARHAEAVHAVLRGDDVDPAQTLPGYPMHAGHTAIALWAEPRVPATDVTRALGDAAQRLAAAAEAITSLTIPSGERGLWLWVATDERREVSWHAAAGAVAIEPGVRLSVGVRGRGVEGFRRTHAEAMRARGLVLDSKRTDLVTCYADVELICLLASDPDGMRVFVARTLRGLARRDDSDVARLRETLLAYLTEGAAAAGARLHLHKNTIRYRVAQAEELLGHPVTEQATALELALRCVDYLREGVLPDND